MGDSKVRHGASQPNDKGGARKAPFVKIEEIWHELADMARIRGIRSCALVDSASGLVLEVAGDTTFERGWEAAVEYWRMHFRLRRHFERIESLGMIGAIAIHHVGGTLVIVPCVTQTDLVVICVGASSNVLWIEWQRRVRELDRKMGIN